MLFREYVLVVDSYMHERDMAVATISLFVLSEDSCDVAAHLLGCLICGWLPAVSGTWHMPTSQDVLCVFSR